jgi:serine/threonine protein kinase/HD-like signal output (HDOD) protein
MKPITVPVDKMAASNWIETIGHAPDSVRTHESRAELLERILNNPHLPTPPTLALQIVEKSRQPDCTVTQLGDMLAMDPGLCGRLLKTLNSTVYGLNRPVTSLTRAVAMLGLKPLRALVLGLTMSTMHLRMEPDIGLRAYWRDSVAGAIITRELSRKLGYAAPDEDLVASLLRDLGMLLLRQSFPNFYQPIWDRSGDIPYRAQCEWEEKNLGVHHAELGAELLQRWRLPDDFVEPIRYHHHPDRLPEKSQAFALRTRLLDFTSRLACMDHMIHESAFSQQIADTARKRFGMDRKSLEKFLDDVRPGIEEFAAVLSLDIGDCPDFASILAAGCEELIQASLESANRGQDDSGLMHDQIATNVEKPRKDLELPECDISEDDSCEEFFAKLTQNGARKRIQQYEIVELIGQGAMGLVIKAHDVGLGRDVALKFLLPGLARSRKAHERFALEARFAAAIRHDNVVTIFAVSEFNSLPFLVMEFVAGESLQDRLDAGVMFSVADIARIGHHSALGLAAAHELRMIHRDIKPANLLMEAANRRVRLTDFGLARAMDHDYQISQQGILVGTPIFMSPEQVDGKQLTPASDLFSLGSVLYTLCTGGQHPFCGETFSGLLHAIAEKTPTPIQELNPNIPAGLADLITSLHVKDPEARFGPAGMVASQLAKFLNHEGNADCADWSGKTAGNGSSAKQSSLFPNARASP